MNGPRVSDPQKTLEVPRGLFVLRYERTDDDRSPPKVTLMPRDSAIEIILHPDARESVLYAPGSSAVVLASTATQLIIEVTPARPGGSVAATLKLEPLSIGQPVTPDYGDFAAPAKNGLRVIGHVAGLGDVAVDPDQWIAGPAEPARIEGFRLDWPNSPSDLVCRYAVRFAKPQGSASAMTDIGGFVGSRGRALPLVGVVMELSGPSVSRYKIVTEALFLGAPVVRMSGPRVVLSGPTGREPLVGLRLNIEPTAIAPLTSSDSPMRRSTEPGRPMERASSRVRVFRSRPRSDETRS